MDLVSWAATLAGTVLLLITLWDVLLAVLHIDDTGYLGAAIQGGIWRASVAGARRIPRLRDSLLALAGPVMIVATFTVWIALFIVGFALIYWPRLAHFASADEIVVLTFVDALYFSGVTGTVLGYGDLTPLTPGLQILAFVEAGLGFALLTGIVTFLISIVSGVAARNALAVRLQGESGGTGEGTELVVRCLEYETVGDFRSRLQSLLSDVHHVQEKMRQFPMLDLYQRSRSAQRDPDRMLATFVDAALACRMVALQEGMQRLRPIAAEMQASAEQLMHAVATRHMRRGVREALREATLDEDDRARVERVRAVLSERLGHDFVALAAEDAGVLQLASRSRVFFDELDRVTGWRTGR